MTIQDCDILALRKESHPRLQKKEAKKTRIPNLHVTSVERKVIHLMYVEARMPISRISLRMQVTVTSAKNKVIKHMTTELELSRHQDLRVIAITARSMDIEPLNVDQSLCGHQINQQRHQVMEITTIRITAPGIAVTTHRNMDTLLRIS